MSVLAALLTVASGADPAGAGAVPPDAVGSVNQVFVTGASPGATVELFRDGATTGRTLVADVQGSAVFGNGYPPSPVPAGTGYTVRSDGAESTAVTVTDPDDHPDAAFYSHPDRSLTPGSFVDAALGTPADSGFQYLQMRDGVTLSVTVREPL
ncbi:MAG: hypothetical protein AAGK32_19335, partial [Actinomycetota bacterium]